jgi:hypothetical protein
MPEEKKRFKVPRGGRVEIGIAGDAEETARPSLPDPAAAPGVPFAEDEDTPLQRRARPGALAFLDLGTRLRSVPPSTDFNDYTRTRTVEPAPEPDDSAGNFNEYLEIEIDGEAENLRALVRPPYDEHTADDYGLGTNHVNADVTDSLQLQYNEACLGSLAEGSTDPVSPLDKFKANGSGRAIPACAPVPYVATVSERADYHASAGYPTEAFDFTLYGDDEDDEPLRFPNTTFRESVADLRKWANDSPAGVGDDIDVQAVFNGMDFLDNDRWKEREHREGDSEASERWNPDNLTGGEAKKGAEHDQKGQGSGFNLKLDSRLIYEPFDTGDAEHFKVTKEPSFGADEATLKLTGRPTRVFLRPQLLAFGRVEEYLSAYHVSIKSHTFRDDETETPWPHHKQENYSSNYAGGLSLDLTLLNVYDPTATPQTFTVTVTKTPSAFGFISATVSGTPAGDGSYTWTDGFNQTVTAAPGIQLSIFFDSGIPNGSFMSYDILPSVVTFTFSDDARADLIRGMHVGRWPFLPRSHTAGWDSLLTFAGQSGYDYTDAYNGVHYVYDPAVAVNFPGRAAFHSATAAKLRQVYDRHPSRDLNRLAYLPSVLSARQLFFTYGMTLSVSEATAFAIRGAEFVGGVFASASTVAALNAQAEAAAASIATQVAALETYFEDPSSSVTGGGVTQRLRVAIVPAYTVPAGVLCGIVEHGSAVFYVWRRTPETRGGFDPERNQGAMSYPFLFPYD